MRSALGVALAVVLAAFFLAFGISPANATPNNGQVCAPLDSGKIDVPEGTGPRLTITAPKGFLIAEFCVKAGSANQGEGPQYVGMLAPTPEWTIEHTSGKDISHYSVRYVPVPVVTPEPEEPPFVVPPQRVVQTYECIGAFVIHNESDQFQTWVINGQVFEVAAGASLWTDRVVPYIAPDADGNYVITVNGFPFKTVSTEHCIDTPPVIVEPPVETPEPTQPPTETEPPVVPEPTSTCPDDEILVEDGSCVPPGFFEPTPEPTPTDEVELIPPVSSEAPVPSIAAPAPTPVATPVGQPATLPQTGLSLEPVPVTILAVFLLAAGIIFTVAQRVRNRVPRDDDR